MNVLLTTDSFPPGAGGSGRSTAALAKALKRRGHRVRVVVGRREPSGRKEWEGVEVGEVPIPAARLGNSGGREREFAKGIAAAAGEEAWDLAHAQHWLSAAATRRALPRLPTVVTVRDYWPVCIWSTRLSGSEPCPGCSYGRRVACVGRHRPLLWPLSPLLPPLVGRELAKRIRVLESASAVVAVSRYVAETIPLDRVRVIPNVVAPPPEDPPRPEGIPDRYLLFAGKLEPGKAPDRLLPILEAARAEIPLLVAGSGSLEAGLRARGGGVRYLGWVDDERLLALIRHAECLLFPSRWQEPLARVLLDALACGAVIVAEPTGGTEEILVDGESGLLGRGVKELGRALRRVLDDPLLARKLREGARRRAREVFSEEVVLPRVEALYRSVSESSTGAQRERSEH
jgi:glycosyltransferase involved in cell wall biosynthesis